MKIKRAPVSTAMVKLINAVKNLVLIEKHRWLEDRDDKGLPKDVALPKHLTDAMEALTAYESLLSVNVKTEDQDLSNCVRRAVAAALLMPVSRITIEDLSINYRMFEDKFVTITSV